MKNPILFKIAVLIIMGLSFFLCLRGLKFGLPSVQQNKVLFSDSKEEKILIPLMVKRRQEIYSHYSDIGKTHQQQIRIPKAGNISVNLSGNRISISENKLDAMRSFMMKSQLPDEPFILKVVSQINWREFDFNPRFFAYGGGYLYSAGAAYKAASLLGLIKIGDAAYYLSNPREVAKLYMAPKVLAALAFVLSIPLMFMLGRELYGFKTGLIAGLFYAFTPIITVYSHFYKPHVLILPLVLISMLGAAKLLRSDKGIWYIVAGLFAGLAAGTFYFAGAVILCACGSHIVKCFSKYSLRETSKIIKAALNKNLAILCGFVAVGFFIVNPYWLVVYKDGWFERGGLGRCSAPHIAWTDAVKYLFITIPAGVGWFAGTLFFCGLFFAFIRRSKEDFMLLFLLVPFLMYAASSSPIYWHEDLHMSMVVVPCIILLAARFCAKFPAIGKFRGLGLALAALASIFTLCNSFYYSEIFVMSNNKLKAGSWINENIKPDSIIGSYKPFFSDYKGHVPFRQAAYNLVSGPSAFENADFYITVGSEEKEAKHSFEKNYAAEKKFSRPRLMLDRFFSNHIVPFMDEDVVIYKRK